MKHCVLSQFVTLCQSPHLCVVSSCSVAATLQVAYPMLTVNNQYMVSGFKVKLTQGSNPTNATVKYI